MSLLNADYHEYENCAEWAEKLVRYAKDADMHKLQSDVYHKVLSNGFIGTSHEEMLKYDIYFASRGFTRSKKYDGIRLRFVLLNDSIYAVYPKSGLVVKGTLPRKHNDYEKIFELCQKHHYIDAEAYVKEKEGHSIAVSNLSKFMPFNALTLTPILSHEGMSLAPLSNFLDEDIFAEGYVYSKGIEHYKIKRYHKIEVDIVGYKRSSTGLISAEIVYNDSISKAKITDSKFLDFSKLKCSRSIVRCRINQANGIEEVYLDAKDIL